MYYKTKHQTNNPPYFILVNTQKLNEHYLKYFRTNKLIFLYRKLKFSPKDGITMITVFQI